MVHRPRGRQAAAARSLPHSRREGSEGCCRCSAFGTNGLKGQMHRMKKRKSSTAASPKKVRGHRQCRIPRGRAWGAPHPRTARGWGRAAAAPPPPPPPPPPPSRRGSARKSRQRLRSLPERRCAATGGELSSLLFIFDF